MTHDPLCPVGVKPWKDAYCCQTCNPGETPSWERTCQCDLIAKVRADERDNTLDDAIALLWEMNCKRLWWDDMLTWCISVNEAIYNIDNLRGKKEGI